MVSFERIVSGDVPIAVIGLGYVGLPLAISLAKHFSVIGYDQHAQRIDELRRGKDRTGEVYQEALSNTTAYLTADPQLLEKAGVHIIAVPTPIDAHHTPDLIPLLMATRTVASFMQRDSVVVYESTVWPGATEEKCVPVLENVSGMRFGRDFTVGYSPERINPGDKEHTVTKILKVTSGSTPEIADKVDALYKSIIEAGTHKCSSIKVAEASKVIENTQRDVNIALVNELALIFNTMGINTNEVIEAAATKWNFIKLTPGLVGGHCIGVDPYYLTYKAEELGYKPNLILGARQINNGMGKYVAERTIKLMIKKGIQIKDSKVLVLGLTFKENCPDIRNTKVIDIVNEMKDYGCIVDISDYWASADEVRYEYGLELIENYTFDEYQAIIVAVGHDGYKNMKISNEGKVIFDIKSILKNADGTL